ncbi:MAG: hypothetical protein P8X49_05990 [Syntrophobacterales bacterium]
MPGVQNQIDAVAGQFQGQSPADPPGGPGDDQGLASQFGHVAPILKLLQIV